jgi:putative ABC transport system permease protein
MDIRPILSTLRRHKIAASLIVLEIALSCAIICNALFLVGSRVERMHMDSGIAENELVDIEISGIGSDANAKAMTREDLAALKAIPGVSDAMTTNQIPFGQSSWNSSVTLKPDQKDQTLSAAMYLGSEDLIQTLGLKLIAGRMFDASDYVDFDPAQSLKDSGLHTAIITRTMAKHLFPGKSGVGEVIYMGDKVPITVVGVVDSLARPSLFGSSDPQDSMIMPIRIAYSVGGYYVVRTTEAERARVIKAAVAALEKNSPNRLVSEKRTYTEVRDKYFRQDRAMVWLLVSVCIALLIVTALGIVGLASFWVQQRTKQIGIRRALGATRGQILSYFRTENFLLASFGIVIGMGLAYGINLLLMKNYELARLPAYYLPFGAVCLWLLGQLAVYGPARRAAAVPPAVATRSV